MSLLPKSKRQYVKNDTAQALAKTLSGAVHAPMPVFIEPMMATLVDAPPSGNRWVHEVKFDGYRLQVHRGIKDVTFYTRRGYDWTERFRVIEDRVRQVDATVFVMDGEVIVEAPNGGSDFGALESDLAKKGGSKRLVFYAFDLLYVDGWDLRKCALLDRKKVLAKLIGSWAGPLRLSEHLEASGRDVFKNACNLQLEGIVSKLVDSRYVSGRATSWAKITCRKRDTFVIAGLAFKGPAKKFDGIYLGRPIGKILEYAGKVERGFTDEEKEALIKRAQPLKVRKQPLSRKVDKPKAVWLKPVLYADVEYRALTGDGKLRHPSFKGVREDF